MILRGEDITLIISPTIEDGEERLHIGMDGKWSRMSVSLSQDGAAALHDEIGSWLKRLEWVESKTQAEGKNG